MNRSFQPRTPPINLQLELLGSGLSLGMSSEHTVLVLCLCPPGLWGMVGLSGEQGAGLHIVGLGGHLSGKWSGPAIPNGERRCCGEVTQPQAERIWVSMGLKLQGPGSL